MALKQEVEKRRELKKRIPKFVRVNAARLKKLRDKGWRKPKGRHNKIRRGIKGEGKRVKVGYAISKEMKHIHPSGYREVMVYNLEDAKKVNKEEEAIRIASSVGLKKRIEIIDYAFSQGIKVLNPNVKSRIKKLGYSSLKELREVHGKESKKSEDKEVKGAQEEEKKEVVEKKEVKDKADNKNNKKSNKSQGSKEQKQTSKGKGTGSQKVKESKEGQARKGSKKGSSK